MEQFFKRFTEDVIATGKFEIWYTGELENSPVEKMVAHNAKVQLVYVNKETPIGVMHYIQVIGIDGSNPNPYENDYVALEYYTEPTLSEFALTYMRLSGDALNQDHWKEGENMTKIEEK